MKPHTSDRIPALFFDEEGCGPNYIRLRIEYRPARVPERGDIDVFGLRLEDSLFGDKFTGRGGFALDRNEATALHRALGEALAQPPGPTAERPGKESP